MIKQTLALVGLTLSVSANAAQVTTNGDDVRFTYDDSTLYGTGSVVGNAILFTPTDFVAQSTNGGIVTATEMLNLHIEVINVGTSMSFFQLIELGDYFLEGAGATAQAGGVFEVSSNNNAFSDSENFDAGTLSAQGSLTEWDTTAMISLSNTFGWQSDTDVDVDITNILTATTTSLGEQSLVQKKLGGVGLEVTLVPVPAAAWLFGSALIGLAGIKRKK